jgi:hypothetical protein
MTEEKKPTLKTQNSPEAPDSEETRPADATGFFNREFDENSSPKKNRFIQVKLQR